MKKVLVLIGIFVLVSAGLANASLENFLTYTENGAGLSIDALGVRDSIDGTIQAEIPSGASVYKAFLYSASVGYRGVPSPWQVTLDGNTLTADASSRVDVGTKQANSWVAENRWDVTSIVNTTVGGGSGIFNFTLRELGDLDGEILAVLYNDATKPVSTAFLFDGESATGGDTFNIGLTTPVNKSDPNFQAIMSLGISYGYQPAGQYSRVDVNGQRLTTSAGGQDDGLGENGGLITAGGIGDSILNPANPFATDSNGPRYDDELYSLNDFLNNGDTLITINTLNPSNDDNIFFMGLTTLGEARIIDEDNVIPEPATLSLLGLGLVGLIGLRKRTRK